MDEFRGQPTTSPSVTPRPLRVLLVEDHDDTVKYIAQHLTNSGHVVLTARNAGQAAQALENRTTDLLLCDINLPDGDGCELLQCLGPTRPALCIAMSGRARPADLQRSEAAGFDHHLVKPFLPEDLDALLGHL